MKPNEVKIVLKHCIIANCNAFILLGLKILIGDRTKYDTTDLYFKFTPEGVITLYIAGSEEPVDVTKYKLPSLSQ